MGKNNTTCGESTTVRSFVLSDLCLAQQSNRLGPLQAVGTLGRGISWDQAPGFWVAKREH